MVQPIQSHEYKVILYRDQFIGKQADLLGQAQQFWQIFEQAITDLVFDTDGQLDQLKKKRLIRFYIFRRSHTRVFFECGIECRFRIESGFEGNVEDIRFVRLSLKQRFCFIDPVFIYIIIKTGPEGLVYYLGNMLG